MRSITVTLDGQSYTIYERRTRESAAWRKKLEEPFRALAERLGQELSTETLPEIIRLATQSALASPETIQALLLDYAPDLREALADAYDSEVYAAFLEVMKLVYPFGALWAQGQALMAAIGASEPPTSPSSRSQAGGDGMTSSTR